MVQVQQEAEELFDILDPVTGYPTGEIKPRHLVHRDGDWHGAFHLWIFRKAQEPIIYLQRRAESKDVAPGYLDVPVGGHYRAGEKISDGVREVKEEIGLTVNFEDLTPLGKRLIAYQKSGVKNNEIVDVFLYKTNTYISEFQLHSEELAGLYEIPISEIFKLFTVENYCYQAQGVQLFGQLPQPHILSVTKESFVPSIDAYLYKIAIQIERFCEGKQHLSI